LEKDVNVLRSGINIERIFIAKDGKVTVGAKVCSDCSGRTIRINYTDCRKYPGLIIGINSGILMTAE
jgi:hypothetical protein